MKTLLSLLSTLLCLALTGMVPAAAQYPMKPVHLVVPFPAGGPSDTAARALGQVLAKSLTQPIIIENRPGASGALAAQAVMNAAPDGYTLLWGVGSMVAIPLLQKKPPFQAMSDFTPISSVGRFTFAMYVHPHVPATSIAELITFARANPDKLNYAASNWGELMATAQFMKAAGIAMVAVNYKGAAQAMPDLLAGRVQVNIGPIAGGLAHVKDGRLRLLAILSQQRSTLVPDVPTMAEVGWPSVSVPTWQAIFAPPKTPQEIVDRVSREVSAILRNPEMRETFERMALEAAGSTPEMLAATIKEDLRAWTQFVRESGMAPE